MSTTVGIINDPSVNSVAEETPSDLLIENSIVAYHTDGGVSANIRGTFAGAGQPVMPDWSIAGILLGGGAPPVTADPLLAPLGEYGGPTKTMRPTSTAGLLLSANASRTLFPDTSPATPLLVDQRGTMREVGLTQVEVGSVEFLEPFLVLDIQEDFLFTNILTPPAGPSLASSWYGQTEEYCPPILCAADNNDAMRSPTPVPGQYPSLTAEFYGAGVFSYWAKTIGVFGATPDLLAVDIDNVMVESIFANNGGWTRYTTLVEGDGPHTVEWESIPSSVLGQAWIDEVRFYPVLDPATNDLYDNRIAIGEGQVETTLLGATNDGGSSVSQPGRPDIWYVVSAPSSGTMQVNTCGTFALSGLDTVLSLHLDDGQVGTSANEVSANDQWSQADPPALPCVDNNDSSLAVTMGAAETLVLRVSDFPDFGGNEIGTRTVLVNVLFEPDAVDTDFDGVTDDIDNCTFRANADQYDSDGDSIGNLCDGDIGVPNDCIVNVVDLGVFKAAFFSTPAAPNWNPDADFTNDNVVNAADLGVLKMGFLQAPGPSAIGCN